MSLSITMSSWFLQIAPSIPSGLAALPVQVSYPADPQLETPLIITSYEMAHTDLAQPYSPLLRTTSLRSITYCWAALPIFRFKVAVICRPRESTTISTRIWWRMQEHLMLGHDSYGLDDRT